MTFLEYPKCSTCQRAKKWLMDNHIDFVDRDIVLDNPTTTDIKNYLKLNSNINKFFNTSGILYKENHLKEKLPLMSDEEKIALLATNGKLVKRPLVVGDDFILIGFKEEEWKKQLL